MSMQLEQSTSHNVLWFERRSDAIRQSLDHLLSMARRYRGEGNPRQAMEIYWRLFEDHPATLQSIEAQQSLLDLAEAYERDDARHTARAVYERLSD
jgi:DNA-binding SARP family transcriptional activator